MSWTKLSTWHGANWRDKIEGRRRIDCSHESITYMSKSCPLDWALIISLSQWI